MEREERVPLDIFRNGFFRHRMRLDQIGVMVERRLDDSIDQIFGKIFVGDSKVIEPDGRIILDQGPIGPGRDRGGGDFGQLLSDAGDLFRAGRDKVYGLLEPCKRGKRRPNGGGRSIKLPLRQLLAKIVPGTMLNKGRNSQHLENLLDVSATGSAARPSTNPQAREIVERLGGNALMRHELKRRVVQREHDAHRAIVRSLRPIAAVPPLQGGADIDEGEHGFAFFEENDILHRALSRFGSHLDLQRARENGGQSLAVDEIDAARRCGGQGDATRRRDLLRHRHVNGRQKRGQKGRNETPGTDLCHWHILPGGLINLILLRQRGTAQNHHAGGGGTRMMEGSQDGRRETTAFETSVPNKASSRSDIRPIWGATGSASTLALGRRVGLGLKGRLQLAFGAITLLVVIATGVGLYAFFQVGKSLQRITEEALPPALAASELSNRAEFVVGVGPALLAANNADEINRLSASVAGELTNVTTLLDQLRRADVEKGVLDAIGAAISNLGANLALLQTTTLEKVGAETRREALVEATFAAHREFDEIWEPRFADMRSKVLRLQRALVSSNESQQDRRADLNSLDQTILALLPLEQIRRDFSATFETALRAATTNDPRELAEFKNQAQRSIRSIDGLVSDIDPDLSTELFRPIARLRANVRGETNIFGLRQTAIETTAKSKQLIAENTGLSAHLHNSVQQLVTSSREDIDTAALVANSAQQFNTNVLLSVSTLSVIGSFLIVWLYVGRSIVARLTQLS